MSGKSKVLFGSAIPERMDRNLTLPPRFQRVLKELPIVERVKGKTVAIKMHLGGGVGYSTIHPLFLKLLVDHVKQGKPKSIFITDGSTDHAADRGYALQTVGAPLKPAFGKDGKAVKAMPTGWEHLKEILFSKPLLQADVLINFSHVKGHGDCGFGGACKNLAMGCVPSKSRGDLHALEGDLTWDKSKCVRCGKCIDECQMKACSFNKQDEFKIFWHHCKMCRHCMLICPKGAITIRKHDFDRFQEGLARVAKLVIDQFEPGHVFHIDLLTHITLWCDCWGLTTPHLVPDVGVFASEDIVAVEHAALGAIKVENVIPGAITPPYKLGEGAHLFQKLHDRDPYAQVRSLEALGAGSSAYELIAVK
jgi:uncharacterized protein